MKEAWAREEAFLILNSIMRKGAYSDIEIRKRLRKSPLNKQDKALVTEIVNGTLRNLIKIDWIIDSFIKSSVKKVSQNIRDILRCGTYQIIFLDRVPDFAICHESVELAKKHSNRGAAKFVNGVLRNISRKKKDVNAPDRNDIINYLSIEYSHPFWMVELWVKEYGIDFTENLLQSNNNVPPLTLRTNTLKVNRDYLIKEFKEQGIDYDIGLYNSEAINIKGALAFDDMDLFKKGFFQVQDESSMLVGRIIKPSEGDFIIDTCSAPGGKATHLAEIMGNKGKILARDIHPHRLKLIRQNCNRLGINIIETQLFDSLTYDKSLYEKADAVLVDAPCSGLGLVRRKPDLRWKRDKTDLEELRQLQLSILRNSSSYVKKGGVLVYSTCTLCKRENIDIVNEFLSSNTDFFIDDIEPYLPKNIKFHEKNNGCLELYPNIHGTDGFFVARMIKNK